MISDRLYTFIRETPQDLPMIRAWLEEAHVRRWWGDPLDQVALIAGDGRFVGAFARGLLANGATRVIIDPDQSNQQAIGAYRKAGFRPLDERETSYGRALLMALDTPVVANGS